MIIRNETIEYIAYTVHRLYFNSSCLNILIESLKDIHPPKHIPIPDDLEYETISDILKYFSGHKNRKVGMRKILEILKLVIDPRVHNKLGEELSRGYISEFNKYLGQDKLEIQRRGNDFKLVELTEAGMRDKRTLIDHISKAIEYFKSEYSKVNVINLLYEYDFNVNIGELFRHQNSDTTQVYKDLDIYENLGLVNGETKAFIYLFRHGYIKDFEVKQRPRNLGDELDYAVCHIDESKFNFTDVMDTDLGIKKVNSRKSINSKKNKPENHSLNWSDVEIKFIDDNNIQIYIKGKQKVNGDYTTFGFKKPDNISWEILRVLSITKAKIQGNKEFFLTPEMMFSKDTFTRSRDKKNLFQTYKSALSKALREYFGIIEDPIPFDKAVRGYNPLLKITPEKDLRSLEIQDTRASVYTELLD